MEQDPKEEVPEQDEDWEDAIPTTQIRLPMLLKTTSRTEEAVVTVADTEEAPQAEVVAGDSVSDLAEDAGNL